MDEIQWKQYMLSLGTQQLYQNNTDTNYQWELMKITRAIVRNSHVCEPGLMGKFVKITKYIHEMDVSKTWNLCKMPPKGS